MPEGFSVVSVSIDGTVVDPADDGAVLVSEGVDLASGKSQTFSVTVKGQADLAGNPGWTAIGQCEVTGEGNSSKGLSTR